MCYEVKKLFEWEDAAAQRRQACSLYAVIYRRQSHDNPGGAGSAINLMQLSVSERSTSPPSTPSSINSAPLLVFLLMETHGGA